MPAIPGILSALAQFGLDSIQVRPKRAIGPFTAQVTISETHHDEIQITDHPVEQGAMISDHAFKHPASLTLQVAWSDSPSTPDILGGLLGAATATVQGVQSLLTGNNVSQSKDVYEKLLKLQVQRVLMDVYTGKRVYQNMLIRSITVPTGKESEFCLVATIELRQVLIATTQTIAVPVSNDRQKEPQATGATVNRGTQNLQPGSTYVERPTRGGQ